MSNEAGRTRVWRPDWPCSVGRMLLYRRRGAGDPTYHLDEAGRHWRGIRTPEGPATLVVGARPDDGEVLAEAWGPGATWALDSVPGLLGADDDPSGFEPRHPGRGGHAAARPRPHRAQRPGHGVPRPGDPGAEGDRPGGVRGVPDARAQVRRARTGARARWSKALGAAHS
ncbi:hypothetical protein [Nocardioides ungokensis]|uniref:hypothetical protein n=1 Tax=Nocardioides ungokensis TaxID=1643322 RepID=UPI001FE271C8|nr:hypothetical protein [Nocardioides ungokensis]